MKFLPNGWFNKITKDCKFLGEVHVRTKSDLTFQGMIYETSQHDYPYMVLTKEIHREYIREYFSDYDEARKYMMKFVSREVTTHMRLD